MKSVNYNTTIEINASAEQVFSRISDITKWWSRDFEGHSKDINEEFIIHHPGQHYSKQRVIESIPYNKIVWLVTESKLSWLKNDQEEWTNTKMNFLTTAKIDKTILRFTHEGLTPQQECYVLCEQGWNIVIKDWLKYYIETGKPSPEMKHAAEIRNRHLEDNQK